MITPTNITNYNRTQAELEEFILFAILVAGKTAKTQAKKLEEFLSDIEGETPFAKLTNLVMNSETFQAEALDDKMRKHKLGQYLRLKVAFLGVLMHRNKLDTITLDELESLHGIGPKTARFFLLHSRPNQKIAALDTHILKFMSEKGYKVPKTTPSKKKYGQIEKDFLTECEKAGKDVAEMDLEIWKSYSK